MGAPRRAPVSRKPKAPADCESAVYDGRTLRGWIIVRRGEFTATNADRKRIGKFASGNDAMRAILAAARVGAGV
jgi:hypothetical protein